MWCFGTLYTWTALVFMSTVANGCLGAEDVCKWRVSSVCLLTATKNFLHHVSSAVCYQKGFFLGHEQ